MWVAGFSHQAGLVERMTSPASRSPWLALGSGVGEGSPGPDREELGGWDPSPRLAAAQQRLPVVWPQSRGQTSPVAGTGSGASSQPQFGK